ncbi:DUF7379 domain-containing protein [Chitinimonas naiadis]
MSKPAIRLPLASPAQQSGTLPAALGTTNQRSATTTAASKSLLSGVRAGRSWTLASASRSDAAPQSDTLPTDRTLLALEASDGSTVYIRADALAEQLSRSRPDLLDANGNIDLAGFRERSGDGASRGVGEWIWQKVTELVLDKDDVTELMLKEARKALGDKVEDLTLAGASWVGAQALMWAIESWKRSTPFGLYQWDGSALQNDRWINSDQHSLLVGLGDKPGLLFIHGTASHTLGGFGNLPGSEAWPQLRKQFEDRIFGFEHPTFSQSPIQNAIDLVSVLPKGARLSLVSHSRGGLVADLLCLDVQTATSASLDALISDYRRQPRPDEIEAEQADPSLKAVREQFANQEQALLRELVRLLQDKSLKIERYVRVACPARGTALLSDNLDVFLSGLLTVIRRFGAWSAGAAVGAAFSPIAGKAAQAVADEALSRASRLVLEIADKRLQPQVVPGIEAMLPEAPMSAFLGRANSLPNLKMAVIAGDIEGGNLLKRIGVMFTDWMFFDRADNDLVVDTDSMYGGLAWQAKARAIFVQGPNVNHFRYFTDSTTTQGRPLPLALSNWLISTDTDKLMEWPSMTEQPLMPVATRAATGPAPTEVVVYLPGIMGTALKSDGDTIWLNPVRLAMGGLGKIGYAEQSVDTLDLLDHYYGKLARHLGRSHIVVRHGYDWRQPIQALGIQLADKLRQVLDAHPGQPVRILAHSMGGLVVRAAFAAHPKLWEEIVARDGRLVMLGTPNHGSHLFVQTLLGLSDTIRMLARLDLRHDMQEVLDIVAGFPGALHLLPAPGFVDTGGVAEVDYYQEEAWRQLKAINHDFWFGKSLCGVPAKALLQQAQDFWAAVGDTSWVRQHPEHIAYVYGKAENTPCGLRQSTTGGGKPPQLELLGTPDGDGSVSWASGKLPDLPADRQWLMQADHSGLTGTEAHFDDILLLLTRGVPAKLASLPQSRGVSAGTVHSYRAGPPEGYMTEPEVLAKLFGAKPAARKTAPASNTLQVSVLAMDLRFTQVPILCGHYRGDPISGAEALIDQFLVDGALRKRQLLGIHAGQQGSATVVLMPRSAQERNRQAGKGAVVVGLGEMGNLSADGVTESVRAGVLRYLMHAADRYGDERKQDAGAPGERSQATLKLRLASVLLGSNSAAQLDPADSVRAIVLGVLKANREFAKTNLNLTEDGQVRAQVTELELVEVYRDAAISAAYAVRDLGKVLERELQGLGAELQTASELRYGDGCRDRLCTSMTSNNYWPRLIVCDADRQESRCGPECYSLRVQNPIPAANLRQILTMYGCADKALGSTMPIATGLDAAPVVQYAERFKFLFLGEKARAETLVMQRQPGLVESLASTAIHGPSPTSYTPGGFGNTLFQLLVPQEFKSVARKTDNLILAVDEATANLPWELMEADGEPLIRQMRMVRQFITPRFRLDVIRTDQLSACVIANPSTEGFFNQFGDASWHQRQAQGEKDLPTRLVSLQGAEREGDAVASALESGGYQVTVAPGDSSADEVFTRLFATPYKVLAIAAHGIYGLRAADGSYRSGVVLSDGLLLSAAEIGLLENVPDLVFLSCCNLGQIGEEYGRDSNRLAYSLARELIEMGTRCVVAAGWEVDDSAAQTFASAFFELMAVKGASFGEAITVARRTTYELHPSCNTWGAYHAYGDPNFQLKRDMQTRDELPALVAPEELLDWINQQRLQALSKDGKPVATDFHAMSKRITQRNQAVPVSWLERGDIQQALGRLYSEYGMAGFAQARLAYLRAIGVDGGAGPASARTVEQLANIEARMAVALIEAGLAAPGEQAPGQTELKQTYAAANKLIDDAIRRLSALLEISETDGRDGSQERLALLGSAFKRKAAILMAQKAGWPKVRAALIKSRDRYAQAEGKPTTANWNPYPRLNRLQLDALIGEAPDDGPDAAVCAEAAEARLLHNSDFFDAVMVADAALVDWLNHAGKPSSDLLGSAAKLLGHYLEASRKVLGTQRQRESVVQQLLLLARFIAYRDGSKASAMAGILKDMAASYASITDRAAGG